MCVYIYIYNTYIYIYMSAAPPLREGRAAQASGARRSLAISL